MSNGESPGTNVAKLVGCGCGVLVLVVCLSLGGCFLVFTKSLKSAAPYTDSLAAVQSNPATIEALGEPIEPGIMPTGTISLNNDDGEVDYSIGVSGPDGEGTIKVKGTKTNGVWTYEIWELRVDGQPEPIPLGD
jgi:hypothetical protein